MPNCIFCKIVRGELPSIKVYEDADTLAFLTIQPTNAGHTLVIPKEHAATVFEATPELWGKVQETVRKVSHAVEKGTGADGVNINMNNREHAGQVVDHIHIHVIPRFKGDSLALFPHHDIRDDEKEPVAAKIRAAF
jgi:histidine triad (HIT) family protein